MFACQTGQANSRWTRPSFLQYSTKVVVSIPKAFILLSSQIVLLALLIIWIICESHLKFDWTSKPRRRSVNSMGKLYFLARENSMVKHFFVLAKSLFQSVHLWKSWSSCCNMFSCGFKIVWNLSWKLKGYGLLSGYIINDLFRFTEADFDESSIY